MTEFDEAYELFPEERKQHIREWMKKRDGKEPLPRQQKTCLEDIKDDHKNRYNFALKQLHKNNTLDKVFDAGCGIGYGSRMMSMDVKHIDCVDISSNAADYHRKFFSMPNINFIQANILEVEPQLNPPYDGITCFEFLEHVADAPKVMEMFGRLSNVLITSVPNEVKNPFNPEKNITHIKHYTPDEFTDLIKLGGFTNIEFYCQESKKRPAIKKGVDGMIIIAVATK